MKRLLFLAACMCIAFITHAQIPINNATNCPIRVEAIHLLYAGCVKTTCAVVVVPGGTSSTITPCPVTGGVDDVVYRVTWAFPGCGAPFVDLGVPSPMCSGYALTGTLPFCPPCRGVAGGGGSALVSLSGWSINVN